ncbi:MAG: tetraacyldisaccharide 4'-kinase [Thermoguttaceae bacterium]
MLSPSEFRNLISGRQRGVRAACLRTALAGAELPYRLAVGWRNRRYDRGGNRVHKVGVPVISVGNLTLGGTGKTPMVAWVARRLRDLAVRVTLISRGYGAEAGSRNDEAVELERRLPDVPHLQDPDRLAAAAIAIEELGCQVILLDDAFQHRRIHRDLDIVLLDALEPFGFDRVFPRGTLREPLRGLRRAHALVLTRADMIDRHQRDAIRRRAAEFAPDAPWSEVVHAPQSLLAADGAAESLDRLHGLPLAAFCGIGNPAGFRHTLDRCGYEVAGFKEFSDHHRYTRGDIDALAHWAADTGARAVVCTAKDLVKIGLTHLGTLPLHALTIGMEFLEGEEEIASRLATLARIAAQSSP